MTVTTLSSREFNQDASKAKKAAQRGPVFITDRGRPAHVLLTIEEYRRITGDGPSLVELLAFEGDANDDFDRILEETKGGVLARPASFD